ncbi:MAG TPA: conjugal transfer protein TraF [Thermoanaerobaculia bacterium]|nr:conjugal transfer protein TraF [Thermoanaerobaculia bacterium]
MLPFRRFFLVVLAVAIAPCAFAQNPVVGPRAAGMGGASVGVADDGTALWTNPAGLGRDPRIDIEIFGGAVATNRGDFTAAVDRLSSIDLDRIRRGLDLNLIPGAVRDLVSLARPGTGVVGSGTAGLVVGKSGFALGIGDVAYAGVYPIIDLVNVLPPAVDPARSFNLNRTSLSFAGLEAREARLGYGTSLFSSLLYVGGAVRYIKGRTYFVRESLFDEDLSDPVAVARKAFRENQRDTNKLAFDAGAMLNLAGIVRVGLVSTSINEPEFDVADPASVPGGVPTLAGAPKTLRLPRTLRAGVAVQPVGVLLVAIDYDLRETATLIPGAGSRQLAAGVELKLPLVAIRAGGFRDQAAIDPHWAYSLGFGLGLKMLSVNASVVFSTEGGTSLSSTNRRDLGGAVDARFRF